MNILKNKPKYFFSLTIFVLSFFVLIPQVNAHVLEADQTIGAVIHIDPDDDPIAGRVSTFYFEFKDKTNRFTPQECECSVTIYQGEKSIYTQELYDHENEHDLINPSLSSPSFSYTFQQKDLYRVELSGRPRTAGDFDEFVLNYDVRVEREDPAFTNSDPQNLLPENNSETNTQPLDFIRSYLPAFLAVGIIGCIVAFKAVQKPTSLTPAATPKKTK